MDDLANDVATLEEPLEFEIFFIASKGALGDGGGKGRREGRGNGI